MIIISKSFGRVLLIASFIGLSSRAWPQPAASSSTALRDRQHVIKLENEDLQIALDSVTGGFAFPRIASRTCA